MLWFYGVRGGGGGGGIGVGIYRDLVVPIPGAQARVCRFEYPQDPQVGLAWSLYKCAALWKAVYDTPATENPL